MVRETTDASQAPTRPPQVRKRFSFFDRHAIECATRDKEYATPQRRAREQGMGMPGRESFETIAGCKTRIMRDGQVAPLLYLHGGGGAPTWAPFFARLAERFDVIVPEHPGFGGSDAPPWLDNIGDLAYFYLDLLDHFRLRGVHLAGISIGAWLACEIAIRDDSALAGLTLLAAHGISLKGVRKADTFLLSPEEQTRHLFHDQSLAQAVLARGASEAERDLMAKNHLMTAKLAWEPRFFNPHLEKWLHRIGVPTLIVWGEHDRIIPPAYGEAFQRLIPGSRLEIIGDCGHSVQTEKTDLVAAKIAAFAMEAKPG
jgi:pimeloyl-ACP methyl ester carboxylesterase